jgi:hypothetical protein
MQEQRSALHHPFNAPCSHCSFSSVFCLAVMWRCPFGTGYSQISDVVRATAADHGLPYENFATFPQAWWAMFTYLRDLGRPDFVSKTGQKGAPPLIHTAKVHAA